MKQEIILCKGLSASGKTTWSKQFCKEHPNYIRINKDDLREMYHAGVWSKKNEKEILKLRDNLILHSLENNKSIIVDDTNLSPNNNENRIQKVLQNYNTLYNTDIQLNINDSFFEVDIDTCIERDKKRDNSVGKKIILNQYKLYRKQKSIPYKVKDNKLSKAYIFDIDGTLAFHNGRNPFDLDNCGNDKVIEPVLAILDSLYRDGSKIILMSGRDSSARALTENWLKEQGIPYNHLFMRIANDNRKDFIIKKELYETYIKDNFNIIGVFDDRPQVRRMWIKEGLFVFSVYQDPYFLEF